MVKNPLANAGDTRDAGLIPGSGRSPGVGDSVFLPGKLGKLCLSNKLNLKSQWLSRYI